MSNTRIKEHMRIVYPVAEPIATKTGDFSKFAQLAAKHTQQGLVVVADYQKTMEQLGLPIPLGRAERKLIVHAELTKTGIKFTVGASLPGGTAAIYEQQVAKQSFEKTEDARRFPKRIPLEITARQRELQAMHLPVAHSTGILLHFDKQRARDEAARKKAQSHQEQYRMTVNKFIELQQHLSRAPMAVDVYLALGKSFGDLQYMQEVLKTTEIAMSAPKKMPRRLAYS